MSDQQSQNDRNDQNTDNDSSDEQAILPFDDGSAGQVIRKE